MPWRGAHAVVGYSRRLGEMEPGREREEGIQSASAPIVEIDIDPPVVGQNKITDGIGPLDIVRVPLKRLEEPRILFRDERMAVLVRPELVLVILVEREA